MMDEYSKNSLLGQLESEGMLGNDMQNSSLPDNSSGQYLPFGILTGNFETTSPFEAEIEPFDFNEESKIESKIVKKRLNDLDNNIFQEGNFIDIEDSELTRREKAKKIRFLIKKMDEKIYMLEDSDDEILLQKLKDERETLKETLALIEDTPSIELQTSNISKNANLAVEKIAKRIHLKEKIKKAENLFFTFFPILRKNFLVRKALNKLVMLNESAKELILKKIPYGESEGRYSDFIAYLSCANVIHAKLTKKM